MPTDDIIRCLIRLIVFKHKCLLNDEQIRTGAGFLQALLDHGANIEARMNGGITPLLSACVMGRSGAVKVNSSSALFCPIFSSHVFCLLNAEVLLLYCSKYIQIDLRQNLITRGAQVDARNNNNDTPLTWASSLNELKIVGDLIAAGGIQVQYYALK